MLVQLRHRQRTAHIIADRPRGSRPSSLELVQLSSRVTRELEGAGSGVQANDDQQSMRCMLAENSRFESKLAHITNILYAIVDYMMVCVIKNHNRTLEAGR